MSNGLKVRAVIVATVIAILLPSTVLADEKQDCEKGSVEVRIAACSNVLRSDPSNFYALANRGTAYNATGEYGRALADLKEAFQHAPVAALAGLYLSGGVRKKV
jgi:hypothetical protein